MRVTQYWGLYAIEGYTWIIARGYPTRRMRFTLLSKACLYLEMHDYPRDVIPKRFTVVRRKKART